MKNVKIVLTSAACVIAIGSAFAFSNPFVATQAYRVDPATGDPVSPLTVVGNHFCAVSPSAYCKITYTLDAQGNPILTTGVKTQGSYTVIP